MKLTKVEFEAIEGVKSYQLVNDANLIVGVTSGFGSLENKVTATLFAASPELLNACKWALEQFKRLADEGRYPEFMLTQNGGEGVMPLVTAIKLATEHS